MVKKSKGPRGSNLKKPVVPTERVVSRRVKKNELHRPGFEQQEVLGKSHIIYRKVDEGGSVTCDAPSGATQGVWQDSLNHAYARTIGFLLSDAEEREADRSAETKLMSSSRRVPARNAARRRRWNN